MEVNLFAMTVSIFNFWVSGYAARNTPLWAVVCFFVGIIQLVIALK